MSDYLYRERSQVIAALSKVFPASIERHEDEPGVVWDDLWRNVVFIDLPTGQVSWHIALPDMDLFEHLPRDVGRKWDGHDTVEKYRRLNAL